jgi:hypothetical protein
MPRKPMTAFDLALRWMNVFLRGLHLAAVILLGAALLGAPLPETLAASAVAVSGLLMFALDLWRKPPLSVRSCRHRDARQTRAGRLDGTRHRRASGAVLDHRRRVGDFRPCAGALSACRRFALQ